MSHDPSASPRLRRLHRRYRRMALIGVLIIALGALFTFTKQNPFANTFIVRAVFSSAAQLHTGGEVRISGIQVGSVTGIAAGPRGTALVTISLDGSGRPVHRDATLTIKPRLVLEGNAYVDLNPGSPDAPVLDSGAEIPEGQTATSVQVDQLFDTFDVPTRDALQSSVAAFATGLGSAGQRAAPGSGAAGLRDAVRAFDTALPPVTTVAGALQGTQPGDLGRSISSSGDVTKQLAQDPNALADLVSSYNTTFGALAAQNTALAESISGFDAVLKAAPAPLRELDAALPTLTSFARELRPTFAAVPAALTEANSLLDQVSAIVQPAELPTLLAHLDPVLGDLPGLETRLRTLFDHTKPVTDCIATHVVPVLNMKIQDGVNTTGDPLYLDLVHAETGLTGFSSAVDGNGGTVRVGITTGDRIVDTLIPSLGRIVARLPGADQVRPNWLGYGVLPPYRPDQLCASQPLPNLSVPSGQLPDWARGSGVSHFSLSRRAP